MEARTKMKAFINSKEIEFRENDTVLAAAKSHGFFIPSLCELADICHAPGTCRVCLVQIQRPGSEITQIVTSCNTPLEEGMRVLTRTPELRRMQRLQVELLLADHNQDCASCIRHGNCELQDVAQFVGLELTRYRYPHFFKQRTQDKSSSCVVRDMSKCIRCFRCLSVCREIQGVDALVISKKGLETEIGVRDSLPLNASDCVGCGQCTLVCPVGALAEKNDIEQVIDYLYDPEIVTVFQVAPAVRTALGEDFGFAAGENVQGQLVGALQKLGADIIQDTNFTADLVIMEEGSELLQRVQNGGTMPMFTSCCPGWVNFAEKNHPELLPNISSARSSQQCFGVLAKTYMAEQMEKDPAKMRVISIMPCTAKKGEAQRAEFKGEYGRDVDVVLTTREFSLLLKREGIHLRDVTPSEFDAPLMSSYSGAAAIFGTTGGVMEAAVRTVYYVLNQQELPQIVFTPLRGMENIRVATVQVTPDRELTLAVAHSLKAAETLVQSIQSGELHCDFVEIMACPGGCMCGGGQPRTKHSYNASGLARRKGLFAIDEKATVRQSHKNQMVQYLYEQFMGEPLSEKSHHLLHTTYSDRKLQGTQTMTMEDIWQEVEERI